MANPRTYSIVCVGGPFAGRLVESHEPLDFIRYHRVPKPSRILSRDIHDPTTINVVDELYEYREVCIRFASVELRGCYMKWRQLDGKEAERAAVGMILAGIITGAGRVETLTYDEVRATYGQNW